MEDMDQWVKDYQKANKLVLHCQEGSLVVTIKIIKKKVQGGKATTTITIMISTKTIALESARKIVN